MKKLTRRQILRISAGVTASVPLSVLGVRSALAQDTPHLDPENPQAKALAYTHESPHPDKKCSNCQLYTGEADADWGPCTIFPGKHVAADGYCDSWVKKSA